MSVPLPGESAGAGFAYHVCGLGLASELELPGLRSAPDAEDADVVVRHGSVEVPALWPPSGIAAWPSPEADVLSWAGRGALRIAADGMVVDSPDEPFARQCVVGPGLGLLLHRRGHLVLHGSAVDVGGRALVLLGQKGAGKSTTAAALLARGHALLTDDLVAVAESAGGEPLCATGPIQMKLWPESADAFGLSVQPFVEGLAKGVWLGARPAERARLLVAICVLEWGDVLAARPLTGAQAFGAILENAYAPRFIAETAHALVGSCAQLSAHVRVLRMTRPRHLSKASVVAAMLEEIAARHDL